MDRKPLIFRENVKVRFSDVDRYQHVSTSRYSDYIFSARADYISREFGLAPDHFERKGIGFYVSRILFQFRRPIAASVPYVTVESFASEPRGARAKVLFKILDNQGTLCADGELDMVAIDLKSQKPFSTLPEEIEKLLWEPAP